MAGHSKFKNIQHRKGAQDGKRAKLFSKIVKEIVVAVKLAGTDPANNPRLRNVLSNAKSQNLPKDRIERALTKASDPSDDSNYAEIRYEGFGPGGVSMIIETVTDNKNRTVAEIRTAFSKYGGTLGENGSVSFMFDRLGKIEYGPDIASSDKVIESIMEAPGIYDIESDEDQCIVYTDLEAFSDCLTYLEEKSLSALSSGLVWKPKDLMVMNDPDKTEKLIKLIDVVEDSEDVQDIFMNCKVPDHN